MQRNYFISKKNFPYNYNNNFVEMSMKKVRTQILNIDFEI
jgi:hypothetical protein